MIVPRVAGVLALLVAVLAAGVLWPGPPAPVRTGELAGFSPGGSFFQLPDTELARDLDAVRSSGASWVRLDLPWQVVEPVRGRDDWTPLDRVVRAAHGRGLRVLALPAYTPAWARPGCDSDKCPPADPRDYGAFVARAALRYGPDVVQAWEIWNEPNISAFWRPEPDPDAYARLLTVTVAALRRVRPDAFVVSAGLSPALSDGQQVAPVDFVRRLYALAALRAVDAVGMHPYSATGLPLAPGTERYNTFLQMEQVREVMVAHGDAEKQVWGTEFGVATGRDRRATTAGQQAAVVEQAYARLADGTWPWLGLLLVYSLRDLADAPDDWQSGFGLVRVGGEPKPALAVFRRSMQVPVVGRAAVRPLPWQR